MIGRRKNLILVESSTNVVDKTITMNPILRDRINFFIKRPTERGRRSFSILRKTKKPNGQIIYENGNTIVSRYPEGWIGR